MSNKRFVTLLAAAASLCLAGSAHADGLAYSVTNISKLNFFKGGTTTVLDRGDFGVLTFTDQANLNANGSSAAPLTFDGTGIAQTVVGGLPASFAGNPFPTASIPAGILTAPGVATGGFSAAKQTGIAISGITANPYTAPGAVGDTSAYASVTGTGATSAQTSLSLTSGFSFTLASAGAVTFAFDVDAYQVSILNTALSASTASSLSLSITGPTGAQIFSWDVGSQSTGATNVTAPCNVSGTTSVAFPNVPNINEYRCNGSFSATSPVLFANTNYNFTITQTNRANVISVPEPSSMALVGLALVGLGFAGQRRAAKR